MLQPIRAISNSRIRHYACGFVAISLLLAQPSRAVRTLTLSTQHCAQLLINYNSIARFKKVTSRMEDLVARINAKFGNLRKNEDAYLTAQKALLREYDRNQLHDDSWVDYIQLISFDDVVKVDQALALIEHRRYQRRMNERRKEFGADRIHPVGASEAIDREFELELNRAMDVIEAALGLKP